VESKKLSMNKQSELLCFSACIMSHCTQLFKLRDLVHQSPIWSFVWIYYIQREYRSQTSSLLGFFVLEERKEERTWEWGLQKGLIDDSGESVSEVQEMESCAPNLWSFLGDWYGIGMWSRVGSRVWSWGGGLCWIWLRIRS
jgi:hypothetical protein